jgi:hypothetical protein
MKKELMREESLYMCVCTMSSWDHLGMLKYYVISNWEPAKQSRRVSIIIDGQISKLSFNNAVARDCIPNPAPDVHTHTHWGGVGVVCRREDCLSIH